MVNKTSDGKTIKPGMLLCAAEPGLPKMRVVLTETGARKPEDVLFESCYLFKQYNRPVYSTKQAAAMARLKDLQKVLERTEKEMVKMRHVIREAKE